MFIISVLKEGIENYTDLTDTICSIHCYIRICIYCFPAHFTHSACFQDHSSAEYATWKALNAVYSTNMQVQIYRKQVWVGGTKAPGTCYNQWIANCTNLLHFSWSLFWLSERLIVSILCTEDAFRGMSRWAHVQFVAPQTCCTCSEHATVWSAVSKFDTRMSGIKKKNATKNGAVHIAVACAARNRAWPSRATLWLLARLCAAGLAVLLPQKAPRPWGNAAWASTGAEPSLPYLTRDNLAHARVHMQGYVWGPKALPQMRAPGFCAPGKACLWMMCPRSSFRFWRDFLFWQSPPF